MPGRNDLHRNQSDSVKKPAAKKVKPAKKVIKIPQKAVLDAKDVAQIVMGRLAELENVTVKSLHQKYGAPHCD